jgi:hypothetical protein
MPKRGFGSVYQRGGVYWLKYYKNGRPFRESSKSQNRQEAERLLKRRLGELATGRFGGLSPERIRMSVLFDDLVEDYATNGRKSLPVLLSRLRLHIRPFFDRTLAAQFGTDLVKKYTKLRQQGGCEARNRQPRTRVSPASLGTRFPSRPAEGAEAALRSDAGRE